MAAAALAAALFLGTGGRSLASNHLDTPTAIANPQANIGDLYAWISSDGSRLNLVMDIVGHSFSDKLDYVFHIDSGTRFGATTATVAITCRIHAADDAECRVGDADQARGDASKPVGLDGQHHRFRVFAGLRDDPFFNNVKGTRAALQLAMSALKDGAVPDAAGCPSFDPTTSRAILAQWRQTEGRPGTNFLAGWVASSLVISVDLGEVAKGGRMLAVWAATTMADRQLDRAGRPMMKNALIGLLAADEASDTLKEDYNKATPATSMRFVPEIERSLAFYDGFDGTCGNQLLAGRKAEPSSRYRALATLFADDRLWINSAATVCMQLFAVEQAALAGRRDLRNDCGGRSPTYNTANVFRSLLVDGSNTSVDDGVDHDELAPSATVFPFLVAPAGPPAASYPYGKD